MPLTDYLGFTYDQAAYAYRTGRMTEREWTQYRAIWRYSAPRFTALVNLPSVTAVYRHLDGAPLESYAAELERE